jgi:uncharacterized protein YkwD
MSSGLFHRSLPSRLLPLSVLPVALALALGVQAESNLESCADAAVLEQAVVRMNELRQTGAPCAAGNRAALPLAWEPHLANSAYAQASDLAERDLLSHSDAQQRALGARLRSAGYAAAGAGENLAAGQDDLDQTLQAWVDSPAHCANLMQPEFRDVGLACVQRSGSRYERFWVAQLGTTVRR